MSAGSARTALNYQREWDRLYQQPTDAEAVWSQTTWQHAGTVPTTWLANLMDEPWLTSQDGKKEGPLRELAVRTPATEAILGDDRNCFAYELDEHDALSPAVRALRVETDPQVSEIEIERLAAVRDLDGTVCTNGSWRCVMRPSRPRARSGSYRPTIWLATCRTEAQGPFCEEARPRTCKRWMVSPLPRYFSARQIFGGRRPFVSERSPAERLWRALRIPARPASAIASTCWLTLPAARLVKQDKQILVNTYLYLEPRILLASSREFDSLAHSPRLGRRLVAHRPPVHVVAGDDIARPCPRVSPYGGLTQHRRPCPA